MLEAGLDYGLHCLLMGHETHGPARKIEDL